MIMLRSKTADINKDPPIIYFFHIESKIAQWASGQELSSIFNIYNNNNNNNNNNKL